MNRPQARAVAAVSSHLGVEARDLLVAFWTDRTGETRADILDDVEAAERGLPRLFFVLDADDGEGRRMVRAVVAANAAREGAVPLKPGELSEGRRMLQLVLERRKLADVARDLGVGAPAVSRWSSGDRVPTSWHEREQLAAVLKIPADSWDFRSTCQPARKPSLRVEAA